LTRSFLFEIQEPSTCWEVGNPEKEKKEETKEQ